MPEVVEPTASLVPAADAGTDGLDILHPNIDITVAGRAITVHEYGFFEGMEAAARAPGFMEAFKRAAADGVMTYAKVRRMFGLHRTEVEAMAAVSAGVEPEWIGSLGAEDGELLMATWFTVNSGFFVREAVLERQEAMLRTVRSASTLSTSSSDLPPQASATSTESVDSPSVN